MRMFELELNSGKNSPNWLRSVWLSEDGIVFVPGAIAGNETEAILCAKYDGTPIFYYFNHAYLPSSWMAVEFPKVKEQCRAIEERIKNMNI